MKQAFSKPLILIFFAIFAAGGILAWQYFGVQKPIACTEEAKICLDGSAVGRIGPNCEFAPCPTTKLDETSDWQTYSNKEYGFEIKYPEDLTVDVSSIELINARNGENPFNLKLEGDTDVIYLRLFKRSNPACKQVVKLKEYITCEYSALSYPENQINEFSEKKIGDNTFVYADFEGIEHPNVNFRAIWAFIDSGDLIYKFNYLWDKDSIKPFQQELINKIISTLRFIDGKSQKIAADFCNKNRMYGGTVSYSSPLNFDQDKDEEILLVCGDYPEDEVILMHDKNFFILDRQNQDYKLIWQREMPKDFYRDLYISEINKPKINDVDRDGIDEIFFNGYVQGGTCTGSGDFYFLYSIKYDELFYLEEGSWFDPSCTYTQTSTTTSANLGSEKYKVFRDFLEQKYNENTKL